MKYGEWGAEYLRQAQKVKEHIKPLRKQLKEVSGEDRILLRRRVAMLNEMYLELYHTGNYLMRRGKSE